MRKRDHLAVSGISIVVAAVSLGVALTRYLDLRAYSPKGTAQAAPSSGPASPATPPEQWNNPFAPGDGMKLASRLPAVNAESASRSPRTNFILLGTVVSSSSSARRAILWASGMKEPKAFREREEVEAGAILASVERDRVWLMRGKEREMLEILPVGSPARATPAAAPGLSPPVASKVPLPASAPNARPRPGTGNSPRSSSDRSQALVVAPDALPENGNEGTLAPQERRRRPRGYRR